MRAALILAALALSGPVALASFHEGELPDAGAQDVDARPLNVVAYHPYPDPEGDPWGYPEVARNNTTVGYMEGRYGAYWYPTGVTDGLLKVEGATGFLDTYNALEADFEARRAVDSPVRAALHGTLDEEAGVAAARLDLTPKTPLEWDRVDVRLVLFEDDVSFDGGNGVGLHRFVARATMTIQPVDEARTPGPNESVAYAGMTRLDPSWRADRLGVVASVHHRGTAHPQFADGEVLQSATYLYAQATPTVQHSRGVLLEVLTATWCAACVYGDAAIDELANAYGTPSSRLLDREWTYLRPVSGATMAVVVAVGAAGAAAAWARSRRQDGAP